MEDRQPAAMLREAGQHARERGLALHARVVVIALLAALVLLAAWAMFDLNGIALIVVELAAIGIMLGANRRYSADADRWLQGARGERSIGAVLAELEADGWRALHDVSLGRGNVDHLLVGPGGIFTIETKSHRGRIGVDRINQRMLSQAYAQKKLVERITALEAQPLLVFSEAWLVGTVPAHRKGVTILPARLLKHYISRRRPTLSAEHVDRLHRQLAIALSPAPG